MALNGYQFDGMRVPPLMDALLYSYLSGNKDGNTPIAKVIPGSGANLQVTTNALNITVGNGRGILDGRLIEVTSPITLPVPANFSGYLCFSINLANSNTSIGDPYSSSYKLINNQLSLNLLTQPNTTANINGGVSTEKDYVLASVTSTSSSVVYTTSDFYKVDTGGGGGSAPAALTQAVVPYNWSSTAYWDSSIFSTQGLMGSQSYYDGTQATLVRVGALVIANLNLVIGGDQNVSRWAGSVIPPQGWKVASSTTGTNVGASMQVVDSNSNLMYLHANTLYASTYGLTFDNDASVDSMRGKTLTIRGSIMYVTGDPYPDDQYADQSILGNMGLTWPLS